MTFQSSLTVGRGCEAASSDAEAPRIWSLIDTAVHVTGPAPATAADRSVKLATPNMPACTRDRAARQFFLQERIFLQHTSSTRF